MHDTIDLAKTGDRCGVLRTTSGGTLSVMNGTATVESLLLAGRFTANGFVVSPDGNGVDINIKQPIGPAHHRHVLPDGLFTELRGPDPFTVGSAGLVSVTSGDTCRDGGYAWTLSNQGTVRSSSENGIHLTAGGDVTNGQARSSVGLISRSVDGVKIDNWHGHQLWFDRRQHWRRDFLGNGGTVANFGVLTGSGALLGRDLRCRRCGECIVTTPV